MHLASMHHPEACSSRKRHAVGQHWLPRHHGGSSSTNASAKLAGGRRAPAAAAIKRPMLQLPDSEEPQDKLMAFLVETGTRGSLAVVAASSLHTDLVSHMHHLVGTADLATALQMAAPCVAADAALLLLLLLAAGRGKAPGPSHETPSAASTAAAAAAAADAVYLHTLRYSLLGAASPGQQLLLQAAGQLSEELLCRGVLLAAGASWLGNRLLEAGVCGTQPLAALDALSATNADAAAAFAGLACSTGPQWLAAAAFCCAMGTRFSAHSRHKAAAAAAAQQAAAKADAARQALLRYEPLAVQQQAAAAAAAAAGAAAASGDAAQAAATASADDTNALHATTVDAELAARLAHAWLGARYVVGQASLFAAFIVTDNLLASAAAGLAMQLASDACCQAYLRQRAAATQ